MSIGSLGVIGSVTTGQLQQTRGADADRATHEARTQGQQTDTARAAESAEGLGEMTEDERSSDRDADGRRLWERPAKKPAAENTQDPPTSREPHSVDPTGQSGGQLDLSG